MRLAFTLARDDGSTVDLVVTADAATTVGEVARALAERDPRGAGARTVNAKARLTLRTLESGGDHGTVLRPGAPLGEGLLASGATVAVTAAPDVTAGSRAVLEVRSGRWVGQTFPLAEGSWIVGRSPGADVRVDDPYVSGRHARLEVGDRAELVDLGSANGLVVAGERVSRLAIPVAQTLTLGATEVRIRMLPGGADVPAGRGGLVAFNRSPRVEPRHEGRTFTLPVATEARESPPFPWLAAAAPLVLGMAMAVLTGRPSGLLFTLLSPAVLVGGFLTSRRRARRRALSAAAELEERCRAIEAEAESAHAAELAVREAEAPSTEAIVRAALDRSPLLWTRRPEHPRFLHVRVATGPSRSRSTLDVPGRESLDPEGRARIASLADRVTTLGDAPLVADLTEAGALGCAGPPDRIAPVVSAVLAQLVGLHSPAELAIAAVVSPAWAAALDWLKWAPHAGSPQSPLGPRPHLADSDAAADGLLVAIEALIAARSPAGVPTRRGPLAPGEADDPAASRCPLPALVVLISADAPGDHARLVALSESGPDAGVFPIWIGDAAPDLPAACRAVVEAGATADGTVSFVRRGERLDGVILERLGQDEAAAFGRSIAPVIDAGTLVGGGAEPPGSVSMVELLGPELFDLPSAVVGRWHENDSIVDRDGGPPRPHRPSRLGAIVGIGDGAPMRLELRAHGPHALVGGTTGSGKSEFLQSWVLGLAVEHSPDRVTFLFIDYKGGAAFADCVRLPHCVGLVTDLRPHLVRRALTSLRAELRRRERLLAQRGVKDLVDLERRGDADVPPALIIVIDEFAALATEAPEFVDGVIDLAQRGRSLGLHLVMATQRPSGVIKESIRANANLRIALRMADEADSLDVVGLRDAAAFDPAIPGRALVRSGPARPRVLQAAFTGGWTSRSSTVELAIEELRFGAPLPWPPNGPYASAAADESPSDQRRLVATISAAARLARIPPPRRPWLDVLPPLLPLEPLLTHDDAVAPLGRLDDPGEQRQLVAAFRPDADGHIAFLGAGGSGKTVALRTLALATASTRKGGPVHVYGLDFAAGGLRMLEASPHVEAIIAGDDGERVQRLLRRLRSELEGRADRYAAAGASTIAEYRERTGARDEPRILLLIDGFPAFREEWELAPGRAATYGVLKALLGSGRRLGLHVALTADRSASIPASIGTLIPRRVRLGGEEDDGARARAPGSSVVEESPPGRGLLDGLEIQIAVLGSGGAISTAADQASALRAYIAQHLAAIPRAEPVESLPSDVPAAQMPGRVGGRPVLGMSDGSLALTGFDPAGVLLVAGPPGSGRSNALAWFTRSIRAFDPDRAIVYLGNDRSALAADPGLARVAADPEEVAALARELAATIPRARERPAILIEGIADFLHTPADAPLVELVRQARRHGALLIAEQEVSGWAGAWPLLAEVKSARRGLLLQPDPMDGESLLRTPTPRSPRSEFPPGRGLYVGRGRATRVQIPHNLTSTEVIHRIEGVRLPVLTAADSFARQAAIAAEDADRGMHE